MTTIKSNGTLLAYMAVERFDPSVHSLVGLQLLPCEESLPAVGALVLAQLQVLPLPVVDEGGSGAEGVATLGTKVGLLSGVHHHVDAALLVARKRLRTHIALERFRSYTRGESEKSEWVIETAPLNP